MARNNKKWNVLFFYLSLIMGHIGSYLGWAAITWNWNMGEWNAPTRTWAVAGGLASGIIIFLSFFSEGSSSPNKNDTQFYDDYD